MRGSAMPLDVLDVYSNLNPKPEMTRSWSIGSWSLTISSRDLDGIRLFV